jgi:hypothetical protein
MKDFHILLDEDVWERFYRAFPGRGERKMILMILVDLACEIAEKRPSIGEVIRSAVMNRYGGEDEETR